jgi:tRNA(fMet)-specific endonuclease VapC
MGVILDSSILIAAERRRFDLAKFLAANPEELFFITVITASELLHGCARAMDAKIRERRARFVEDVLKDYFVLPFNLPEAREHARLWAELEMKGTLIGERDLFIAAIARTNGHSLATLNRNEFSRVPDLILFDTAVFALPATSSR